MKPSKSKSANFTFHGLVELIEATNHVLRRRAVSAVNNALVIRNWLWGRYIVEYEQKGHDRARYGEELIRNISIELDKRGLKGCSYRSLQLFKKFYLDFSDIVQTAPAQLSATRSKKIVQTVSAQLVPASSPMRNIQSLIDNLSTKFCLDWSHYVFLTQIENIEERKFYEIESANEGWSLRELKRQFNSSLYERLALSRDKAKIKELSKKGHILESPQDAVKNPYVLEFLGLKEKSGYSESDLETAIIDKLEHFLLELGKGFLFEARQKRFTFHEEHFYVDLVFYNRLLRCYVLIDLKIGKITHQNLGQMQMYVNYFDRHVKKKDENPSIGILLCKTKDDAIVKLTLPKGNKTIFASQYKLYLPSKEDLKKQLQAFTGKNERRQSAHKGN